MLGVREDRVVEPVSAAHREPVPPLPEGRLAAEPVPDAVRPQPMPVVRVLMPVIMVAAMVAMVAVMFMGGGSASPMMLILPLMMGASMLMMFAPPESQGDADESRRTYLRHLGALRDQALANAEQQREHMLHRHPAPGDLRALIDSRRLWERSGDDVDVLEVRFGVGSGDLVTPIDVAEPGATEDLDPVCAVSLRHTVRAVGTVAELPIAVQLRAFRFVGLGGPGAAGLARSLVAQLVVHHGPDTLGISVVGDPQGEWDWLKWLPHTREPGGASHRILLVVDLPTSGTEPFLDDPGYTAIIDVGAGPATALSERAQAEGLALLVDAELDVITASGVETLGRPDSLRVEDCLVLARALTRYRRPDSSAGHAPDDLLGLLGVSDIERLTPETLWPGREGGRSRLMVPLGVTPEGVPVRLDLKESAHGGSGPHGLCIGATGSGKSELLRTLIVALAATHSPDELNLVLVDFKGGATFMGFENLPHTSAVITNLADEAVLVERMYDAISGEMNRRQELLRQSGNFANVTDYTAARLGGREDLAPLPALLIVVDEFSELLSEHPDFADLFVAVGRLGRSLGVHLLLASQRLEEGKLRGLDSHLSYRIGLKTFSAGESRQVLGVTDAHRLPSQPGAGYLRTDADTLTRFQAAYVSGPLHRRSPSPDGPGAGAAVELFTGWEQYDVVEEQPVQVDESTTLLAAVVDVARDTARQRGQRAHTIWLAPLPARIGLAEVAHSPSPLAVDVGIIDRPFLQTQDPFTLDLGSGGGHLAVCGGPQSGKSMTLLTTVAAIAATHPTDQARFYLMDFGGGVLADAARLPHVTGYADRSDPERMRRIVDEVVALLEEPEDCHTFLVIDGWHAIGSADSEFADLQDAVTRIAADGPSARIHLLISTPRWTILRPAVRDLITRRVELRLPDPLDSLIDRKAQEKLPTAPGRGLTNQGEQMLIAYTAGEDLAHIAAAAERAGQRRVRQLQVLPASIGRSELDASVNGIAFGVGGVHLSTVAWDPSASQHVVCVGASGSGKSTLLATLMAGIGELDREDARMVVIDQRRAHLGQLDETMVSVYAAQSASATEALAATAATMKQRLPGPDVTPEQLQARSWWTGPEIYVVIDDAELVNDADLQRLTEFLPHSRDIGLHIVLARKSGGASRALFGGFLAALKDEQPAVLLLDADKDDGPLFGVRTARHPAGRGAWLTRGANHGLVQVAQNR